MFGSLGFPELLVIFGVALLVFGPRKLPEIGRSVGRALGEFRRATHDLKTTLEEEVRLEDEKSSTAPRPLPPVERTVTRSAASDPQKAPPDPGAPAPASHE